MAYPRRFRLLTALVVGAALLGFGALAWILTGESQSLGLSDKSLNYEKFDRDLMAKLAIINRDASGYLPSNGPWNYRFPTDYGPHGDFRSEVWSAYAIVHDAGGQTFATHLSFLRLAIRDRGTPPESSEETNWTTRDMMQGAFVISDATGTIKKEEYRVYRVALSLAGTQSDPASVWMNNWQINANPSTRCNVDMTMKADTTNIGVDLRLSASDCPKVSNNESRQVPFHAYLLSPLSVNGTTTIDEVTHTVTGTAWIERAWGDLPLPVGVIVTDRLWLVIETKQGSTLVGTFIDRERDDPSGYTASVMVVNPDGTQHSYTNKHVELTINTHKINGNRVVPTDYSLEVTPIDLKLTIDIPSTDDWETPSMGLAYVGAIQFNGKLGTQTVAGVGIGNIAPYAKRDTGF